MNSGPCARACYGGRRTRCGAIIRREVALLLVLILAASCRQPGQSGLAPEGAWYPEEVTTEAEKHQEIAEKEHRVLEWLRHEGLSAVLLSSPANFAWITGGGSSSFGQASSCSTPLLILADGRKFIFDEGVQAGCSLGREMQALGYEVRQVAWVEGRRGQQPTEEALEALAQGGACASDEPRAGARLAESELAALRVPLTEWEVRKYRWLGKSCAAAVDSVCRRIGRWWTDRGVEVLLSEELLRRAIHPGRVRVEADTPVPGTATRKIADYALISVSASRWGLTVAMKRAIHFGPVPPALEQSQEAAARVEAGFWARTVPGATIGAIIEGAVADYAAVGFPDEWRRGTPGGKIGYVERDWEADAAWQNRVREFEAFAWNASIGGFAMEDTILLDGDRLVILTEIPGWPVVESKALNRIYRLPAILQLDR